MKAQQENLKQYELDIKNFKEKKPTIIREKIVSGGESVNLRVDSVDVSDDPSFVQSLDANGLTRISVKSRVEWSDAARQQYAKIKEVVMERNHTTAPHNMKQYARDTDHTWHESSRCNFAASNILVCEERPDWAKRRHFVVSAMFGMSFLVRNQLRDNSQKAVYTLHKSITSVEM